MRFDLRIKLRCLLLSCLLLVGFFAFGQPESKWSLTQQASAQASCVPGAFRLANQCYPLGQSPCAPTAIRFQNSCMSPQAAWDIVRNQSHAPCAAGAYKIENQCYALGQSPCAPTAIRYQNSCSAPQTILAQVQGEQAPPPPPPPPSGGDATQEEPPSCEDSDIGFTWLLCPALDFADRMISFLEDQINRQLEIPDNYFEGDAGTSIQGAWGRMRNLAYIILFPIMLVMVIGTALGFEFVSAYTIKRALPRLVIAVIFIAVSYPLLRFGVTLSNDLGRGALGLLTSSIVGDGEVTLSGLFSPDAIDGSLFTLAAAATGVVAIGALPMILSYAVVIAIAVFLGFLILTIRRALVILFIILAPLAILSWIFPGNDKLWKLWWGTFWKLLAVFPMITLLIGAGRVFASIIRATPDSGFVETTGAALVLAISYAAAPFAVQRFGGAFGALTGAMQNRGKGMLGAIKGAGRNATKKRMMGAVRGQNNLNLGIAGRGVASLYRRGYLAGTGKLGLGPGLLTRSGRMRYKEQSGKIMRESEAEAMKADAGHMAGSDDAPFLAAKKGGKQAFIRRYMKRTGVSRAEATRVAAAMETSYGAKIGTKAMRRAAQRSFVESSSNTDTGRQTDVASRHKMMGEFMDNITEMTADGSMSIDEATLLMASAKERLEFSGGGYDDKRNLIEKATTRRRRGKRGTDLITTDEMGEFHSKVVDAAHSGQIMGSNYRTMYALGGQMVADVRKHRADAERHRQAGNVDAQRASERKAKQLYGKLSGLHDMASQVSMQNGRIFADSVLSEEVGGKSIAEEIEALKAANDRDYFEVHKEFTQGTAEQREAGARSSAGQPGASPSAGPPAGVSPEP